MKRQLIAMVAALTCGWTVTPRRCTAEDNSIVPPGNAFQNGKPVRTMKTLNQIEPRIAIGELPFVVSTSGSYFVTGNLTGTADRVGITITTNDVDLDLNGFTLFGVPDSLDGVRVTPNKINVRVHNGVVRGWGRYGINATNAFGVRLDNVRASTNLVGGVSVGHDSMLTSCGAYFNAGEGIHAASGSTVRECKARGNFTHGIHVEGACRVNGCISIANQDSGYVVGDFSTVRDCTAAWNVHNGIILLSGCGAKGNICGKNGRSIPEGSGILVQGEGNRVEENSLTQNRRGIVAAGIGNLIVRNTVQGSVDADYEVNEDNVHGEILHDVTGGTTGFSSSNAWLNFVLPGTGGGQ